MATNDDDYVNGEVSSIYLRSSGKLYDKHAKSSEDGLLSTMWNFPLKGLLWRLHSASFNNKNEKCVMYDERGQIYVMSMKDNNYSTVHLASNSISSMAFILSQPNQIITAYENGDILLLDTDSNNVINIAAQCPSMTAATIRMIRTHPSKPIIAMASDNKVVSLWDISTKQCLRNLRCEERIVDIKFDFAGEMLTVVQELSGACSYSTDSCKPVAQYLLQSTERCPKWTAYESYTKKSGNHQYTILGGDNGMLYVWGTVNILQDQGICRVVDCLGTIELPVQMRIAVDIVSVGISTSTSPYPRIAVLSSEGEVVIIEIEIETAEASSILGACTIMSYLRMSSKIGLPLAPFTVPCQRFNTHTDGKNLSGLRHSTGTMISPTISSSAKNRLNQARSSSENVLRLQKPSTKEHDDEDSLWTDHHSNPPRHGRMNSCGNILLLIGSDGAARIYDTEKSVGYGSIAGTMLRTKNIVREGTLTGSGIIGPYGGQIMSQKQSSGMIEVQKRKAAKEKKQKESNLKEKGARSSTEGSRRMSGKSNDAMQGTLDPAQKSLFELAEMSPKGREVNALKLKAYFKIHGQFPAQYRALIWRFLLRLPGNTDEYSGLVKRGTHPAYTTLSSRYTMENKKFSTRLQSICSLLTHWSPIFAEIPYLPEMAAPFVTLFGSDEMSAFEAVMSMFMWWGHSFHATYPHPPVHIIDTIDDVIKIHDPALHHHLEVVGIRSGFLGWSLIKTMFSEILDMNSWQQWMDFLFLHFNRCEVIILAPVAMIIAVRVSLLASQRVEDISQYMSRTQNFNMKNLTEKLSKLLDTTDPKHLTAVGGFADNAVRNGLQNLDLTSTQKLRANTAASVGVPVLTLPKGRYPAYDGYPVYIVDWEIKERERIIKQAAVLCKHEISLTKQKEQLRNIENDHTAWTAKYTATAENSIRLHEIINKREQEEDKQILQMEKENSAHRLLALAAVDRIATEKMIIMNRLAERQKKLLAAADVSSQRRVQAAQELSSHRKLAEEASKLEREKLSIMARSVAKEEISKLVRDSYEKKEKDSASIDRLQAARWASEDEELRRERLKVLTVLEDIENQEKVLRQRGEVSEVILKMEHEKSMKSATLLADRIARISADRAQTAELKLFAIQQQQRINEMTKASSEQNIQINRIALESASVAFNLDKIQRQNARKIRKAMGSNQKKEEETKSRSNIIIQKKEEKNGRKLYENSLRIQQEEIEKIQERKSTNKTDKTRRLNEQEVEKRIDDDIVRSGGEVSKNDEEKEKENAIDIREMIVKGKDQEENNELETSNTLHTVDDDVVRKQSSLNALDDEKDNIRKGKIIEFNNENARRRRQQMVQNENEKYKYDLNLKAEETKLNNEKFHFDKKAEKELRKEKRKEEREADLRLIRDARERSEAIKKKEIAWRREVSLHADIEEVKKFEVKHNQSRQQLSDVIDISGKEMNVKAVTVMDKGGIRTDKSVEKFAEERHSKDRRSSEKGREAADNTKHQRNDEQYDIAITGSGRDIHENTNDDDDDDESVTVTSNQSETSSDGTNDDYTESNRRILITQEDIDHETEQKINDQIISEKVAFRGEYDMSGAGGFKKGAQIPGVRVLSKAEIKEELRKVSTAAARSVSSGKQQRIRGTRSTQKVLKQEVLQDLSVDNSPLRDRMVREMHMSKYRVRSTSRPPAPPIRVPDKKSIVSSNDTERSVTRGIYSAPLNLTGNRDDSVGDQGQGQGDRNRIEACAHSDIDANNSQLNSYNKGKAVLSARSEVVNRSIGEVVDGGEQEYVEDRRARTRIEKSTDINDQLSFEAENSLSVEGVKNGPGGIVWIDGAPYSDLVSDSISKHRGPRRASNVYPSTAFPVGYGVVPGDATQAPSSSSLSSTTPHPYPNPDPNASINRGGGSTLFQRDDKDGLKESSNNFITLAPRADSSTSFNTEDSSGYYSTSYYVNETSSTYNNIRPKGEEYLLGDNSMSRGDTLQYERETSVGSSYEVQAFIPSNDTFNKRNKYMQRFSNKDKAVKSHDQIDNRSSSSTSSSSSSSSLGGQGRGKTGPVLLSPSGNQKASRKSGTSPQTLDPTHTAQTMTSIDFYRNLQQLADMSVRAVQDVLEESRQERALEARVLQRKSA